MSQAIDEITFLVNVQSETYNHAPYVEKTMDSFCMQKTNFRFVCTFVDDASTDGEPELLIRYVREHFNEILNTETNEYTHIFAQHKENKNCYFAIYCLKYNHVSIKKSRAKYFNHYNNGVEYVAFCEGDDYWLYDNKLQTQLDFLRNNKNYSAYYSNIISIDEHNNENMLGYTIYPLYPSHTISKGNPYQLRLIGQTATIMFRIDVNNKYWEWTERISNGDVAIVEIARCSGDIYYSVIPWAAHRKCLTGNSWTARTYNKDISLWLYKSHKECKDYALKEGKRYINYDMIFLNIIVSKVKITLRRPNKQNLSELAQMLRMCDFKLRLPLLLLLKTYRYFFHITPDELALRMYKAN